MLKHLRQLALESLVYGISGVVIKFVSIFLVPIYTRLFTPADYGVISLVISTMAVFSSVTVLALDSAAHRWYWATQDSSDRKDTLASWIWCQLAVTLAVCLAILLGAPWMARLIVGNAEDGRYFQLAALALPTGTFSIVVSNWLRMQRRPWATSLYALGTSLVVTLLSVLFVVVLRAGIAGVFLAQLIGSIASAGLAIWMMRGWLNPRRLHWERLRHMLRYSLPFLPAAPAAWIVAFADRYFVQFYTSTSEVGLYQIGASLASVVALLTVAFQQAWGPFALSIQKRPDAKDVYAAVLPAYVWLTCLCSALVALLSPEILRVVATPRYVGASSVVGILALGFVLTGVTYIAYIGLSIVGTTTPAAIATIGAAILNVALNVALVPRIGKTGAALATMISQGILPIYVFYRAQRLFPIPFRFASSAAILVFTLAIIAVGEYLPTGVAWSAVVPKLLCLFLFLPLLFALRIVSPRQARRAFRAVLQPASRLENG